jgi:hypothetical protein
LEQQKDMVLCRLKKLYPLITLLLQAAVAVVDIMLLEQVLVDI